MNADGLQLSEEVLVRFLQYCSDYYDHAENVGNLPAVLYVPDSNHIVICT